MAQVNFDQALSELEEADDGEAAMARAFDAARAWAKEQADPQLGADQALSRMAAASASWARDWTRLRWAQSALTESLEPSPRRSGLGAPSWEAWSDAGLSLNPWMDPKGQGFLAARAGLSERATIAARCLAQGHGDGAQAWLKLSGAREAFEADILAPQLWSGLSRCVSRSAARAWLKTAKGKLDPMATWIGAGGERRCVWDETQALIDAGMGLGPAMELAKWGGAELLAHRGDGPSGLVILSQCPELLSRWEAGQVGAVAKKPRPKLSKPRL